MNNTYKICVEGGRDFNNYLVLSKIIDSILKG